MGSTQTDGIAPLPYNPDAYLRMAGYGITESQDAGAGTVNCQTSAGSWEEFRVEYQPDGTAAIASTAFPGVYLRMDGQGIIQQQGACGGTVNCQYGVGPWEKFRIHYVVPPESPR
jgi:phospholipase C